MNDLQREIDAYRDEHWDEVLADIEALVSVESTEDLAAACDGAPFGPGPRRALDTALGIAARMGLSVHDCEGYIGYADLAGASDTQIGIIGHVDVVPAGPGWNYEPYAVTRREGYLLGRGVIDDKGPLMVALHALKFWKDRASAQGAPLPYTVRVLFGANEETNMKDVEYYRAHHDDPAFLFTPDSQFPVGYGEAGICSGTLAYAMEPSSGITAFDGGQAVNAVPGFAEMTIALAPGAPVPQATDAVKVVVADDGATVTITAAGKSAHAIDCESGVNAIGVLLDYVLSQPEGTFAGLSPDLKAFLSFQREAALATDGGTLGIACRDEHFGALSCVAGVVRIEDGVIRQSLDFRYPTTTDAPAIEHCVREAAERIGAVFAMEHDKKPFLMNPDSPAVQALLEAYREVSGEEAKGLTSKGGTCARCFTTGVSFGPEKPWIATPDWVGGMHGPDEGVSEELLKQAFSVYACALGKLMEAEL